LRVNYGLHGQKQKPQTKSPRCPWLREAFPKLRFWESLKGVTKKMKKDGRFTALAAGLKKTSGVLAFGLLLAAAGCVQPADGGDGGISVDPSFYERLVTVRIPVNTAARALTLELAQDSIDFCEVVFKHQDGRIFSASATKDNELSIVLPVGTYETVLLAGTYNSNTLLASAYKAGETVEPAKTRITYELKALNASVSNVEIELEGHGSKYFLDGTTSEGFPYFSSLAEQGVFTAAITIGNFPHAAIFDPVLTEDTKTAEDGQLVLKEVFQDLLTGVAGFASHDILRVLAPFEADLAAVVAAGDYLWNGGALTINELESLEEVADGLDWSRVVSLKTSFDNLLINELQPFITAAKNGDYANAAAAKAWEAAGSLFGALYYSEEMAPWEFLNDLIACHAQLFRDLGKDGMGGGSFTQDFLDDWFGGEFGIWEAMRQGPVYPTVAEVQAALTAIKAAVAATSGLSAGTLPGAVEEAEEARSVTLPFAAGWVDLDGGPSHGTVNVVFAAPAQTGFAKLYFDFAFKAFGGSQVHTWHIKQGLDDYAVDNGEGGGGSILLSVGSPVNP
jgi:hypothetical protein